MAKYKTLIEKPASKASLSIKLDSEISTLHEEVKQLLKETGSKINLDRTLQPIIRDILQEAKHQLIEVQKEQKSFEKTHTQPQKKAVELETA